MYYFCAIIQQNNIRMIDFRQRVKDLCKEQGITQKKVAQQMGITDIALTALLKRGDPHISTVEDLATIFGMSLAEFMQEGKTHEANKENAPLFTCPHCGKEVALTLSAPLNQ